MIDSILVPTAAAKIIKIFQIFLFFILGVGSGELTPHSLEITAETGENKLLGKEELLVI